MLAGSGSGCASRSGAGCWSTSTGVPPRSCREHRRQHCARPRMHGRDTAARNQTSLVGRRTRHEGNLQSPRGRASCLGCAHGLRQRHPDGGRRSAANCDGALSSCSRLELSAIAGLRPRRSSHPGAGLGVVRKSWRRGRDSSVGLAGRRLGRPGRAHPLGNGPAACRPGPGQDLASRLRQQMRLRTLVGTPCSVPGHPRRHGAPPGARTPPPSRAPEVDHFEPPGVNHPYIKHRGRKAGPRYGVRTALRAA